MPEKDPKSDRKGITPPYMAGFPIHVRMQRSAGPQQLVHVRMLILLFFTYDWDVRELCTAIDSSVYHLLGTSERTTGQIKTGIGPGQNILGRPSAPPLPSS